MRAGRQSHANWIETEWRALARLVSREGALLGTLLRVSPGHARPRQTGEPPLEALDAHMLKDIGVEPDRVPREHTHWPWPV